MVIVHPRELDKATVRSLLADAIASPTTMPSSPGDRQANEQLAAALEAARKEHPDDLSIAIADSLFALSSGDAKRIEPALDRLNELVEKTPLDALPEGEKANARQRIEAARQVPLWLVARACRKQKDAVNLRKIADKLAARAEDAAGRQTENQTLMAMLREEGQLALERGDRRAAEAAWNRMLTLVVAPAERTIKKPGTKPKPPAGPVQQPSAKAAPGRVGLIHEDARQLDERRVPFPPPVKGGRGGLGTLSIAGFSSAISPLAVPITNDQSVRHIRAVRPHPLSPPLRRGEK